MAEEKTVRMPVADAYDRWSGLYDAYDNPMVFAATRVVETLAPLAAGADVVEFGCGTGRNLAALKAMGARSLTGCDISRGMLDKAAARDPSFTLVLQDAGAPLPLPDGSADLVLFSLVLEHVADLVPPLSQARRLLRPGGRIAVVEIHPFVSMGGVAAHFRDGEEVVQMPTFPHGFADWLNAVAAAGLCVAECREWRPRDFAPPVPPKAFKRGPDTPLAAEFALVPA